MPDLNKQLRKFSPKERFEAERLVSRIASRNLAGLDCKKLKGYRSLFRVRKGSIRIIFEFRDKGANILSIERRREDTYKL
ncbi:MAG: type II toxin-antitoxin system RelE/ParE family toxin [Candidatus Sungbacteria bacterium]|uniref:Type II toxin-antitoxin system RelE/ParE family toxin n=1 Tax=Candidatus Sungiibacteriota bacterium TaxID=2750080 RepID=A0A931SDT0_9BACT|nr:type II toxin-antitoxin system RelE/ParE family toxin [Candidatus Sungbacteria bacterium]